MYTNTQINVRPLVYICMKASLDRKFSVGPLSLLSQRNRYIVPITIREQKTAKYPIVFNRFLHLSFLLYHITLNNFCVKLSNPRVRAPCPITSCPFRHRLRAWEVLAL